MFVVYKVKIHSFPSQNQRNQLSTKIISSKLGNRQLVRITSIKTKINVMFKYPLTFSDFR